MKSKIISNGILSAVAIICGVALLFIFIYKIQAVLAYLIIAAVVALIGRRPVIFLRRKLKLPNTVSVVLTLVTFLGFIFGVIALFIPVITDQGDILALLSFDNLQTRTNDLYIIISDYLGTSKKVVVEIIEEADIESNVVESMDIGMIPKILNGFIEIMGNLGIGLFSVLFISFFFMKDSQLIQKALLKVVPKKHETRTVHAIAQTKNLLSRYFVGILMQLFVIFIFYVTGLLIAGIENAFVIAIICALFNIIPYIGPMIGGFLMLTLAMTSNLDLDFSTVVLPKVGYVFIAFVVGQLIDNFVSQPFIFSNSVKSHPLEVFLVIIIAGLLFGIVGLIAAIPAYTVLKVILKQFLEGNKIVDSLTQDI